MGSFYVNTTAKAPRDAAVAALRSAGLSAFVAPEKDGLTLLTEAATREQADDAIRRVGTGLSAALSAPCLTVLNHDDDILAYWLFEAGRLTDQYDSWPGYFSGAAPRPEGGDPGRLAAAFGRTGAEAALEAVLRAPVETYPFALERHAALCHALGLPAEAVGFGYDYCLEAESDPASLVSGCLRI